MLHTVSHEACLIKVQGGCGPLALSHAGPDLIVVELLLDAVYT